jgi:hypothetical protein
MNPLWTIWIVAIIGVAFCAGVELLEHLKKVVAMKLERKPWERAVLVTFSVFEEGK